MNEIKDDRRRIKEGRVRPCWVEQTTTYEVRRSVRRETHHGIGGRTKIGENERKREKRKGRKQDGMARRKSKGMTRHTLNRPNE